jgi:hypothetical protein
MYTVKEFLGDLEYVIVEEARGMPDNGAFQRLRQFSDDITTLLRQHQSQNVIALLDRGAHLDMEKDELLEVVEHLTTLLHQL